MKEVLIWYTEQSIKKGQQWYTQMSKVFDAIKNQQINYNWLITDLECLVPEIAYDEEEYCWLTGKELSKIVQENDSQWIWAVLSGFDKSIKLKEVLNYPLPYADGYKGFWQNPPSIQHPLATIEIVPWDSSLTLFFSKHEDLVRDFLKAFPFSEDILEYNTK